MADVEHTEAGGKSGIGSFLSVQDLFTLLNAACGVLVAFSAISGQFFLATLYGIGLPTQYYGLVLALSSLLMISPLRIKKWG